MATKEQRAKWERMGLCTGCGGLSLDPRFHECATCRTKRRETAIRRAYKQFAQEKMKPRREISPDHKCWTCQWSKFEGDRFFCPFMAGECVKEKKEND